jgi:pilus assembly protein Flp/PilA
MWEFLCRLRRNNHGATAIEYGLILALLAVASMVAMISMAQGTTDMWNNVATQVLAH